MALLSLSIGSDILSSSSEEDGEERVFLLRSVGFRRTSLSTSTLGSGAIVVVVEVVVGVIDGSRAFKSLFLS